MSEKEGYTFSKQVSVPLLFQKISEELNLLIEKRERLVKASRDVTYQSKKAIYLLHRVTDEDLTLICPKTQEQLENIRHLICKLILSKLSREDYFKFHRVFSIALQEYVEARLFLCYLWEGRVMTLNEVNAEIAHTCKLLLEDSQKEVIDSSVNFISVEDYLLGMIDVSGELMRYCINCASRNETKKVFQVECFLRQLSTETKCLAVHISHWNDSFDKKLETMQTNVQKVENACYRLYLRDIEFHSKRD